MIGILFFLLSPFVFQFGFENNLGIEFFKWKTCIRLYDNRDIFKCCIAYIYILCVFTEKPFNKPFKRNKVNIPITASSQARR